VVGPQFNQSKKIATQMESIKDLKGVLEDLFERPFLDEETEKIGLILTDLVEVLSQKG